MLGSDVYLLAVLDRIGGIDDDQIVRIDAAENLQGRAVVAADGDVPQLHFAVGPTTATCGPSRRNSMAFTGTVTFFASIFGLKCTSPNEPGRSRPSLLGTSTSVSRVRVVGSIDSAVRATVAVNF